MNESWDRADGPLLGVRLFGPVQVLAAGELLDLQSPKQRTLLAALTVAPGRAVPVTTLVDRLWDENPPASPRASLYSYLTLLRRLFRPHGVGLVSRTGGYLCDLRPDQVDVAEFRQLVEQARHTDNERATELLRSALELFVDVPLAGLDGGWVSRIRDELTRERHVALLRLAELEQSADRLAVLAEQLVQSTVEAPFSEPLAEYAMLALAAAGRRAEAVDLYARLVQRLATELGEQPDERLGDLNVRLLRHDPELAPARSASARPAGVGDAAVPRQLPAAGRYFVGRGPRLAALDSVADSLEASVAGPVIAMIVGMPGVGKTSLAVHWAQRSAERFPDGQLYVDLRGFDPLLPPLPPSTILPGLLEALGVRPRDLPPGFDAQCGWFRTLLADRRVLLVLDNAREAEQVRPLLPGSAGCFVLVTSRDRLTGLAAGHGAQTVQLEPLPTTEAHQLLDRYVGPDRTAAEPEAAATLLRCCAGLPLALSIAGAHAAADSDQPLAGLAAKLAGSATLDVLHTDDPRTTVRTVLACSYQAQPEQARRLFRLLGPHPGPDISEAAAASLLGVSRTEAAEWLGRLLQANLVHEHLSGRYLMADLLRSYAIELAAQHPEERRTALRRVLDHYLHTGYASAIRLNPDRQPIRLADPVDGAVAGAPRSEREAIGWFHAEHDVLLTAVDQAYRDGFDRHCWQLAWTLFDFHDRQGHSGHAVTANQTALAAARRTTDPNGLARTHRGLGLSYAQQRWFGNAEMELTRALDLYAELDDRVGRAYTHHNLAWVLERQDRHGEAMEHARRALDLFHAQDDPSGQARMLNAVGWYHSLLGEHRQAVAACERALHMHQETGSRYGQAATWDSLGRAYHHLGDHRRATDAYQRAADLLHELGDRYNEAGSLTGLGDAAHAVGRHDSAVLAWRRSLAILEEIDHPDAHQVRERLSS